LTESGFQIVKSIGFVAAMLLAVTIQRLRPHRPLAGSWRANAGLWAVDAALLGAVCGGCACAASIWADQRGLGLMNQAAVPVYVSVPLSVLGLDLVSYLWHRANHRVALLWRFHQAHHTDAQYTVTTALRFHPGELLLALPVRLGAVAILGAPIVGLLVFEVVFAFANFWEHGNIDLPKRVESALACIVITPALHRRHHGMERRLLDSNYGTILSVWDRLLGSYAPSASTARIETGLPGVDPELGTLDLLALPARGSFRGR